ncbi:MAG: CvpA family protein [Bacillota bacterium]|nr:CvpA family protein [Bacillota bacterium]
MNGLDLLILGVAALAGVRGLRRGLGREAIGLGATALLLFAALPLAGPVGRLVTGEWWPEGRPYASALGFVLLVLGVVLLAALLAAVWQRLISALGLGWLDALGGAFFGVAKAVIVWLVVVGALSWLPVAAVQRTLTGSVAASALLQALPGVRRQVEKALPPAWSLPRPPRREKTRPLLPESDPGAWRQVREGRTA